MLSFLFHLLHTTTIVRASSLWFNCLTGTTDFNDGFSDFLFLLFFLLCFFCDTSLFIIYFWSWGLMVHKHFTRSTVCVLVLPGHFLFLQRTFSISLIFLFFQRNWAIIASTLAPTSVRYLFSWYLVLPHDRSFFGSFALKASTYLSIHTCLNRTLRQSSLSPASAQQRVKEKGNSQSEKVYTSFVYKESRAVSWAWWRCLLKLMNDRWLLLFLL